MESIYSRQDYIDMDKNQSVIIVGCGGIGFWVAKLLAMSGIKKLRLFDPDVLEISNLNRIDMPTNFLNKNKADVVKFIIKELRPDCDVISFPFVLNEMNVKMLDDTYDWMIDCTDNFSSQETNQEIAKENNIRYMKAGYDGENFSIHNEVAEWGEAEDGYTITPSWCVPSIIIASLAVAKIMKYKDNEISSDIKNLFKSKRG